MPGVPKIDLMELQGLVAAGKSLTWLSKHFDVSVPAIHQAKKKLTKEMTHAAVVRSHEILGKQMDAVSRLQRIEDDLDDDLEKLVDMFEMATTANEKAVALKLKREILTEHRRLLGTRLSYIEGMFDLNAIPVFMNTVMEILSEVDHGARARVLRRLEEVCGPGLKIIIGAQAKVPTGVFTEGADGSQGAADDEF